MPNENSFEIQRVEADSLPDGYEARISLKVADGQVIIQGSSNFVSEVLQDVLQRSEERIPRELFALLKDVPHDQLQEQFDNIGIQLDTLLQEA